MGHGRYTYLEDGTPTWYYAQGPRPDDEFQAGSVWEPALQRVVWNGDQSFAYGVGYASLTWLSGNSFQFSYVVDGESGSERMQRIGGDCPLYAGAPLDGSGHWYSPSKPGFGYSAQFEPGTEVHAAYLYDEHGYPRWLYGQKAYDAATGTVNLLQFQGFCPLCEWTPLSGQEVGTMTRTLGSSTAPDGLPGLVRMAVDANLRPPLQGTWREDLPVGLLSARKNCE